MVWIQISGQTTRQANRGSGGACGAQSMSIVACICAFPIGVSVPTVSCGPNKNISSRSMKDGWNRTGALSAKLPVPGSGLTIALPMICTCVNHVSN